MSTLTEPHTNGHERELSGVRTYRGRKLEDLIPQIRTELGPDAIILRQREGLMGGVGGFFAQKCVEVDAQAAPRPETPRVDIYDEDEPVNGWELTDEEANTFRTEPIAPLPDDFPALPAAEHPLAPPPVAADPVVSPTPGPEAYAAPAPEAYAPPAPEAPRHGGPRRIVRHPPRAGGGPRRHRRAGQACDRRWAAGADRGPRRSGRRRADPVPEPVVPEPVVPEPVAPEPIVAEAPVFETPAPVFEAPAPAPPPVFRSLGPRAGAGL